MQLDNYKISIIMQSFLGDYTYSRTDSVNKFKRAVNSFLNQINDNCELIIVSDGCQTTVDTYNKFFKQYEKIKCIFVEKKDIKMYDTIQNELYYRGFPRQCGLDIAIGSIIAYMDSDDFLLPNFTEIILDCYLKYPNDYHWFVNQSWYDNINTKYDKYYTDFFEPNYETKCVIEGLDSEWVKIEPKISETVNFQPWTLTHLKSCGVEWEDTIGVSEDIHFTRKLIDKYYGILYNSPCYVRCHLKGVYDF